LSQNNLSLKSIIRKFCYLRLNYTRCTDIGNREHEPKEASCHESGNGGKLASAQKENALKFISCQLSGKINQKRPVVSCQESVVSCQLSVVRSQRRDAAEISGSNCGFLWFSEVRK
jgi:hypothetical protein